MKVAVLGILLGLLAATFLGNVKSNAAEHSPRNAMVAR